MVTLKIAWRDILRQRTRTWLTIAAIGFCSFSVLLTMTITRGSHQQMIQNAARAFTGHFQIQHRDYQDDPSLYNTFALPAGLAEKLEQDPRVMGVAPRLLAEALISTDEHTTGALLMGVHPAHERKASTLAKNVREGEFLAPGDRDSALLAATLAKNLEVKPGDEIQVLAQSFYGSLQLRFYKVKGIVRTGAPEFDRALVVLPLSELQSFLEMEDRVTHLAVMLVNPRVRGRVMSRSEKLLQGEGSKELRLVKWEEIMPELYEFVMLDNAVGVLYLAILVLVVAFIVLLTITMSVLERIPEFGVLLAIGAKPRRVFGIIMAESFLMGLLGAAGGMALATGLAYYWTIHPIDLSSWAEALSEFGMEPYIRAIILPVMYPATFLIMMFIVIAVSIFPALRASRIKPVEALRYT